MASFSVEVGESEEATVVRFIGLADLGAESTIEREVTRLTSGHHQRLIVIDFAQLDMIASLALGQLVRLHHGLRRWGGRVRLANPTAEVREVLERCRLTGMLQVFPSVQEAIDAPVD
ncbi:MAG: STAS domain-containing protein [Phycisphaerae bacterium]|nr:STAS domain-containing protein [Phycisphaerae bacterium]